MANDIFSVASDSVALLQCPHRLLSAVLSQQIKHTLKWYSQLDLHFPSLGVHFNKQTVNSERLTFAVPVAISLQAT